MFCFSDGSLWKSVDVDESLLYGPVGGFMGLEELDADYLMDRDTDGVSTVKIKRKKGMFFEISSLSHWLSTYTTHLRTCFVSLSLFVVASVSLGISRLLNRIIDV